LNDITGGEGAGDGDGDGDGDLGGASSGGTPTGDGDGDSGGTGSSDTGGNGGTGTGGDGTGGSDPFEFCTAADTFCDDFQDKVADGWTPSGGTWAVLDDAGNGYYHGNGSEESVVSPSWTDQTIEAKVRVTNFAGATNGHRGGLIARYMNCSSFYVFSVDGNGFSSLLKSTSTLTGAGQCAPVMIPGDITVTEWFDARMEVTGPAGNVIIKTYLSDQLIHNCTNTSNTVESGSVGF